MMTRAPADPVLLPAPDAGDRRRRVTIVGGGLAGLAAAVALVQSGRGDQIRLIESRPRLGGRASSFPDPVTGELVDNCQHVSMACCTNLADFCRRVGTTDLFRQVPDVRFLSPEGKLSRLAAGPWPAPLHLSGSFLRANYLTVTERLRVAYGVARLKAWRPDPSRPTESVLSFLRRNHQTERTIRRYWATVLISALNEQLHQMDIGHARKVFVDGFLRHRDGYRMEIPLVPLGDLYGQRLETWLRANGVEVTLTTGVRTIEVAEDGRGPVTGVWLRSGEFVASDAVILAVPFDRVAGCLSDPVRDRLPGLDRLDQIASSPITGVHFWFDRRVCPYEHVVTVDRLIHWVFDHSAIQGRTAPGSVKGGGQYLQIVISASYDLQKFSKAEIRDAVLAELVAIWPEAQEAQLLRWWVVTEHGATFAVRPGIDAARPPQRTPVAGLFLAGDWTATGWPATMEGAVRSGYQAVEELLVDAGHPQDLVVPDLASNLLARWTLGPPARTPVTV